MVALIRHHEYVATPVYMLRSAGPSRQNYRRRLLELILMSTLEASVLLRGLVVKISLF